MTSTSAQLQGQVPQFYFNPQAQGNVVYQQPQGAQPGQQHTVPTPQEYQPADQQPQNVAANMQQYQFMPMPIQMMAQPVASNQMAPTHVPSNVEQQAPVPVQQHMVQQTTQGQPLMMITPQAVQPMQMRQPVPMMIPTAQYPANATFNFTPAIDMTVDQAANWVRTMGFHHQWPKAEEYALAVQKHELNGFLLHQLTTDDMEKDLGMEQLGHRLTLFNSIRQIFPNAANLRQKTNPASTPPGLSPVPAQQAAPGSVRSSASSPTDGTEVSSQYETPLSTNGGDFGDLGMPGMQKSRGSVIDRPAEAQLQHLHIQTSTPSWNNPNSRCSTPGFSDRMSETSYVSSSSTLSLQNSMIHPQKSSFTLLVTLGQANEESWSTMHTLKHRFNNFGFSVEVSPKESEGNIRQFIIVFGDEQTMNRALSMKTELGLNDLVVYNEPPAKKKGPRPTPAKPLLYKVLNRAKMREGKSMKSTVLGHVNKGDLYWVNQIKGKRARIVERSFVNGRVDPSKDKNLGWVSLRNNSGYMLMSQVLPAVGTPEFESNLRFASTMKNQFKFEVSTPCFYNATAQAH